MCEDRRKGKRVEAIVSDDVKDFLNLRPSPTIKLGPKESKRFLDLVENPPDPGGNLRRLFKKFSGKSKKGVKRPKKGEGENEEVNDLLSLRPSSVIRLSPEESKRFLDLIENPPEPNEALKKAMKRHDELFKDDGLGDDSDI